MSAFKGIANPTGVMRVICGNLGEVTAEKSEARHRCKRDSRGEQPGNLVGKFVNQRVGDSQ